MKPAAPILFPAGPLPWLKPAVFAGALVPIVALLVRALRHTLGADAIAVALNQLGLLALVFLLASLACTPLQLVLGAPWPIKLRKMLGLFGFFYACLHFLTYLVLDQGLAIRAVVEDIAKRPFILVGFSALVLLVPLAVTSTAKMVKRLRFARWKRLHRLAYLTAALGVVHFFLRVKKDVSEPMAYAIVLGALLAIRVVAAVRERGAAGRKSRGGAEAGV
ncbi:MAG: protein-methionine-sulfoxide reductase heme-binding subunit MsrQ [Byssovorax sp.]